MTIALIAYQTHTKTVQELPDPSLRELVMQYIQRCGKGRGLGSRLISLSLTPEMSNGRQTFGP